MYLLLIFLSLVGSCLSGLFGRYLGSAGAALITTSCLFISFLLSIFVFYEVGFLECNTYIKLSPWIYSEVLNVNWGFMFDSLTVTMCFIVTFISFLVHFYSIEYMSHDPHLPRFMSYLSLFTFFMLILVTADNFIQMFIGWEGVGLCSYLLINFWFTRIQANKAAIKAMLLNRVGDFSLLIGIMLIFYYLKAVDYNSVAALSIFLTEKIYFMDYYFSIVSFIGIFLFVGAVGKSAQLGLHTWLPDAMEGPTPVSALIHAATMVTAGVFLLARASFIFERLEHVMLFITTLGAITTFFAATTGLVQNDLKRVIAYSTCSQLGYMVFACGLSGYSAGVFHLSNHAFFKALLFLAAGSVIHSVNDEQDMRKMGGLKNFLPFTYGMMVIGSLALAGFPFLSGFYSKDLILELAVSKYEKVSMLAYILGSISAFLTAFYSSRLLYFTFISKPNGYKKIISQAHESNFNITFSLACLAIPSIFIGYFTKDMLVGVGSPFFNNVLFQKFEYFTLYDAEFFPYFFLKILPVCGSLFGVCFAFLLYLKNFKFVTELKMSFLGKKIYQFLNKKWFFDKIYNEMFGQMFFSFGYNKSYKLIDRGVFEMLGPTGISVLAIKMSTDLRKLQSGSVYHYTFSVLLGITLLMVFKQLVFSKYFLNILIIPIILLFLNFVFNIHEDLKNKADITQ